MLHIKKIVATSFRAPCFGISSAMMMSELLSPPSHVRGMKKLEAEKFSKSVDISYVSVSQEDLGQCMPALKKYLLKMRKLNPVLSDEGTSQKKILLDPAKAESFTNDSHIRKLTSSGFIKSQSEKLNINLNYENWTADEILKAVLPLDQDSLTSFSIIGHIYHVNLRDHLLEYKSIIGQVLLDKNHLARTVVNKINSIDSAYRTFQIEILAGDNDMMAKVRENHCSYEFDFSKVYWNPRLVGEHERIVKELQKGDVLYDVFAGVGPFSVPAARKGCFVLANDLNPESFKWLQHNIKVNKVTDKVITFNKDGENFICEDIKEDLVKRWSSEFKGNFHITMNLPALATEFLPHFKGLFSQCSKMPHFKCPVVHVYCFIKGDNDPVGSAKALVESQVDSELGSNLIKVFHVRTVSNKKEMMRVSFLLSEDILFDVKDCEQEPVSKKLCLDYSLKMGKNKGKGGKTSNIFKVAGARSLKIKNKAKQFTGQLKKLNEGTRKKTVEVDGQLASLHSTLMKKSSSGKDKESAAISELKKIQEANTVKSQELERKKDDINKFSEISMS